MTVSVPKKHAAVLRQAVKENKTRAEMAAMTGLKPSSIKVYLCILNQKRIPLIDTTDTWKAFKLVNTTFAAQPVWQGLFFALLCERDHLMDRSLLIRAEQLQETTLPLKPEQVRDQFNEARDALACHDIEMAARFYVSDVNDQAHYRFLHHLHHR